MPAATSARRVLPRQVLAAPLSSVAAVAVLLATPTPAAAEASTTAVEVRLAELVAAERRSHGLPALEIDVRLVASARRWSAQMAAGGHLTHDDRAWAPADARARAENVAHIIHGDPAASVHRLLMDSPGHRANILSPGATRMGIGVVISGPHTWVTQRFTSGTSGRVAPAVPATAELSERLFGTHKATRAVIVRDDEFADGLTAGALTRGAGPLLFTPPGPALHPRVRLALERVLPRGATVMIVGGIGAVSSEVEAELRGGGWKVERHAGADRFATGAAVASRIAHDGPVERVVLATGLNWPDAATASVFAARASVPVVLTGPAGLPEPSRRVLETLRPREVSAVGGPRAISDRLIRQLGGRRVSGTSREATSVAVAKTLWGRTSAERAPRWTAVPAYHADGWTWALGAAPMAARLDAAVLLTGDQPAREIPAYLEELGYGGPRRAELLVHGPVSRSARSQLEMHLR